MRNYILMNQSIEVLRFEFDEDLNVILNINEIKNIEYAPLCIKNSLQEKRFIEFNNWYTDRGIPIYRDDAKDIIAIFEIKNMKELINRNYALSVSDEYWFKPEDEKIEWKNINYFDNDYDSYSFAEGTYGRGSGKVLHQTNNGKSDKTPNNTSNGQLRKVWIKKDGGNYLYKGASSIHNLEPINEVLASKICEILNVPYVEYTLDVIKSAKQDTLVSVCKCAIDKDEEIIPSHMVLTEKQEKVTKTINDYYLYLEILNEHNVPNAEEYLQKMFILDYIILNEDRHLNNFGIIRDVKTLEWKSVCPIFDTGRSMNTNVTTTYWNFEEGEVKCFTNELISCKNLERFFSIKLEDEQITKLKALKEDYREMLEKYRNYTRLTEEEIELLVNGYAKRVECFENLMKK